MKVAKSTDRGVYDVCSLRGEIWKVRPRDLINVRKCNREFPLVAVRENGAQYCERRRFAVKRLIRLSARTGTTEERFPKTLTYALQSHAFEYKLHGERTFLVHVQETSLGTPCLPCKSPLAPLYQRGE